MKRIESQLPINGGQGAFTIFFCRDAHYSMRQRPENMIF